MYRTVVFQKDVDQEQCAGSAVELTHVAGSWRQLCSCCSQTGHQSLWLKIWQYIEIWILPIVPPHRQETSSAVSEHTTVCHRLSVWLFLSILTQSWSLQHWKNTSFKLLKLVFTLHFASQSFFSYLMCLSIHWGFYHTSRVLMGKAWWTHPAVFQWDGFLPNWRKEPKWWDGGGGVKRFLSWHSVSCYVSWTQSPKTGPEMKTSGAGIWAKARWHCGPPSWAAWGPVLFPWWPAVDGCPRTELTDPVTLMWE